jgi:hypothetical protein
VDKIYKQEVKMMGEHHKNSLISRRLQEQSKMPKCILNKTPMENRQSRQFTGIERRMSEIATSNDQTSVNPRKPSLLVDAGIRSRAPSLDCHEIFRQHLYSSTDIFILHFAQFHILRPLFSDRMIHRIFTKITISLTN